MSNQAFLGLSSCDISTLMLHSSLLLFFWAIQNSPMPLLQCTLQCYMRLMSHSMSNMVSSILYMLFLDFCIVFCWINSDIVYNINTLLLPWLVFISFLKVVHESVRSPWDFENTLKSTASFLETFLWSYSKAEEWPMSVHWRKIQFDRQAWFFGVFNSRSLSQLISILLYWHESIHLIVCYQFQVI